MYAVASLRRWKRAGLLTELRPAEASQILPKSVGAHEPPSPALLHAYYSAHGDPIEALWRRQADRFVEVAAHARPEQVCAAIEQAMPSEAPIRVRPSAAALFVHVGEDVATVSRVVRHARLRTHQIRQAVDRPRDIVRAINAIFAARGYRHRFIELRAAADRHMFVAVDTRQARTLHGWGATTHRDLGNLWSFAGWDRDASSLAAG
ncbi:MAG: hypothetical protein KC619_13355 [Myxococcales bacterium]|nr:hypothetical protein [Myxococcales bacterium]